MQSVAGVEPKRDRAILLAPPPPARVPHLRFLDGVRGITALLVVLHHVYAEVSPDGSGAGLPRKAVLLLHPFAFGHLAVGVFIVLGRSGFKGFVFRRARRILPPYYAALGLSLLLIAAFSHALGQKQNVRWDVALPVWTPPVLVSHALLVHNFSTDWLYRINPPFWSIAVEWQIYFVFALLLFPLWRKTGFWLLLPLALVLGLGPHFLLPPETNGDWFCPWYVLLFTFGMAAAALSFGPNAPANLTFQTRLQKRALVATLVFTLGVLVTLGLGLRWWTANLLYSDLLVGAATAAFLVYAAASSRISGARSTAPPLAVRLLQSRIALGLGAFSYSLYLVHFPLLSLLHSFLRPHFTATPLHLFLKLACLFVLGVPLCLAAAYGFYRVFEKPFQGKSGGQFLPSRRAGLKPNASG